MPTRDYLALVESGLPTETRHQRRAHAALRSPRPPSSSSPTPARARSTATAGRRSRCGCSARPPTAATTSSRSPAPSPRRRAPPSTPRSCAAGSRRIGARGPRDRHRPALDAAAAPARPRCCRPGGDRRRARARRHRDRAPPGGDRARGGAHRGGQGGGVRAAVESDELPNALLTATIIGFAPADQRDLHRAFLDRYFDAIPDGVGGPHERDGADDHDGLLPGAARRAGTLDLTDAFLARDDVPSGARRLVREGRDGIERSLRCQARDASSTRLMSTALRDTKLRLQGRDLSVSGKNVERGVSAARGSTSRFLSSRVGARSEASASTSTGAWPLADEGRRSGRTTSRRACRRHCRRSRRAGACWPSPAPSEQPHDSRHDQRDAHEHEERGPGRHRGAPLLAVVDGQVTAAHRCGRAGQQRAERDGR